MAVSPAIRYFEGYSSFQHLCFCANHGHGVVVVGEEYATYWLSTFLFSKNTISGLADF